MISWLTARIILYCILFILFFDFVRWTRAKQPTQLRIHDSMECIGKRVYKRSRKTFKSKLKVNTVTGVTVNKFTGKEAFTFKEDDSIVDVWQCQLYHK